MRLFRGFWPIIALSGLALLFGAGIYVKARAIQDCGAFGFVQGAEWAWMAGYCEGKK